MGLSWELLRDDEAPYERLLEARGACIRAATDQDAKVDEVNGRFASQLEYRVVKITHTQDLKHFTANAAAHTKKHLACVY